MDTMNALVRDPGGLSLRRVSVPVPAAGEVLLRVEVAGLCRTDVLVARGRIAAASPVILGHEFAGTVVESGPGVSGFDSGAAVAVLPLFGCCGCSLCQEDDEINCLSPTMLGVHRDGAFAQFVAVPATNVFPLPDSVSLAEGAYAEPVAAALGVLQAGIRPAQHGCILGNNRFSVLLERLLRAHGFSDLTLLDPSATSQAPESHFDFVVETQMTQGTISTMARLARPRGLLVLKSRQDVPVTIDARALVSKQLTIRAVNYGSFRKALGLLAERAIDLDGLLGPVHALADHEEVFAAAERSEAAKLFFDPWQ
jgi:threonine dehydrogenase-like Zn-dependent dehydrogenase